MSIEEIRSEITSGSLCLGIELGSTRIKSIVIDSDFNTVASGYYEWENKLDNGYWTYSLDDIWTGVQESYKNLRDTIMEYYGVPLNRLSSIGISAMMHGYLAFDNEQNLLVPFRTWRNNTTEEAAKYLSSLFQFNIPQRWSISHFYQALLNNEEHVEDIDYITTLSGYIHMCLTGEKVLGVGDASGMFPIDSSNAIFKKNFLYLMNNKIKEYNLNYSLEDILPTVLTAGQKAGYLTQEGATLLDTSMQLEAGIPLCPPEGDAGTGMIATNSISERTGNISAGTSAFSMIVLEQSLKNYYPEIDIVTTPSGNEVAMVHTNNCSSDLNSWVNLFKDFLNLVGHEMSKDELFSLLLTNALSQGKGFGGLLSYGYISGEHLTDVVEGRPMLIRMPDSDLNVANLFKTHLYSSFSTLKIGINLLKDRENINIDTMVAHGGLLKTENVAQRILTAVTETPITVLKTANEGGSWGIAVLARYLFESDNITLKNYLDKRVFKNTEEHTLKPNSSDIEDFNMYIEQFSSALPLQRKAHKMMKGSE